MHDSWVLGGSMQDDESTRLKNSDATLTLRKMITCTSRKQLLP